MNNLVNKQSQNLYVFGYGLALLIPFFVFTRGTDITFSMGSFLVFVSAFVLLLTAAVQSARLTPLYNLWILVVQVSVFVFGYRHGFNCFLIFFLAGAALILLITVFKVEALTPVYKIWMTLARAIGTIISTITLAILFYFVFGLVGIILRLLKKDLLDRKQEPKQDSYWLEREKKEFSREDYQRQF